MSRAVRYKKHLTTLQVFLSIVLILLTACVAVKAFFLKAPEQKVDELPSQPSSTGDPQLSEEEQAAQKALRSHLERKGGFYTILVSGSDDGNGNSDTNILVAVDTVNGYVYGVSIPRDSKAVWDGKSHKINAAFGKGGMTKLAEVVSDQLGIPVDYTVSVDLTGFEALVEAIGGVNFDVPINMDYDDPIQRWHRLRQRGLGPDADPAEVFEGCSEKNAHRQQYPDKNRRLRQNFQPVCRHRPVRGQSGLAGHRGFENGRGQDRLLHPA